MRSLEPRHISLLRRMAALGTGWHHAEAISPHGDGRTVGASLAALHRRGLVDCDWGGQRMVYLVNADGTRTQACRSATTWTLTSYGVEAAK